MTGPSLPTDDRLVELLAMRAVEGVDADGLRELGDWADCDLLDEAAGVLAIGMLADSLEPMPDIVRANLNRVALAYSGLDPEAAGGPPATPDAIRIDAPSGVSTRPAAWLGAAGWLAAAACLLIAVLAWTAGKTPPLASPSERAIALANRPGVVHSDWLGLDDAALADAPHRFDTQLKGEVLWDPETNEGYMVFEGLAANDPSEYQYQLWIFDAERPTGDLPEYGDGILSQRPVDGGVFDAAGTGRVVIPINAKLPVGKAAIFAVTVEPPGGVVVSKRDIVALAMAP